MNNSLEFSENDEINSDEQDSDNEFNDDADNESEENDEDVGNSGWADAFAKVLQQEKPKNKKYLVLSKAKKLSEQKDKIDEKLPTFEIIKKEDDDNTDIVTKNESKPSKMELELAAIDRKDKNIKMQELRVTPAQMNAERERSFKRIAQRGVVQLFNAVRTQQRELVDQLEKAGPLDHKRDEVLNNINKRNFLDMLMGSKGAKSENVNNPVKMEDTSDELAKPSQWSVLKDNFMTNKKQKSLWDESDDDDNDKTIDVNSALESD